MSSHDQKHLNPCPVILRPPVPHDGASIKDLVHQSRVLEPNSLYSYLLMCRHFADTCVVAEQEKTIEGFVTAYIPPHTPEVIFVWQVAVQPSMRGRGLGLAMLRALVERERSAAIRFLEASVTPSNVASQGLFRSFARSLHAKWEIQSFFGRELFSGEQHEPELLWRIGPFDFFTGGKP